MASTNGNGGCVTEKTKVALLLVRWIPILIAIGVAGYTAGIYVNRTQAAITQVGADARYALKGDAYTKAESGDKWETKTDHNQDLAAIATEMAGLRSDLREVRTLIIAHDQKTK